MLQKFKIKMCLKSFDVFWFYIDCVEYLNSYESDNFKHIYIMKCAYLYVFFAYRHKPPLEEGLNSFFFFFTS